MTYRRLRKTATIVTSACTTGGVALGGLVMSQKPALLLLGLLIVCPTIVVVLALSSSDGVVSEWMRARPRDRSAKAQAKVLILNARVDARIRVKNAQLVTDLLRESCAGLPRSAGRDEGIAQSDALRSVTSIVIDCLAATEANGYVAERECHKCKSLSRGDQI